MCEIDILLIYPQLGSQDTLLRDIPLSLIYAATDSVKNGYKAEILDCRLFPNSWKLKLDEILKRGCSLVGLSVMTGNPIRTSLEISKYVKQSYGIPVIWGGPHPTILPEETLQNKYIDYVIRDWGSEPLYQLISCLKGDGYGIEDITGLGYKKDGQIILNGTTCNFEILNYRDIPYHLIDIDSKKYNRLQGKNVFFPIYTAMGCPYKCAFCMSPSVYKKIKGKKWIPFEVDTVLDHIEFLLEKYDFQRLQIYDDDSFVDPERMRRFFIKYVERDLHNKLKLDFRGVRINELDRVDDEFLKLMVKANVEVLAIGVESGSDDTLMRMRKGITVEQILQVSKRLRKYPTLRPHYNILCGTPGETYEDLVKTKELMEILVKDNPSCFIGTAGDWKPYPGSVMTELAEKKYKLKIPQTLEEWTSIDSLDAKKIVHPWYTRRINNYIKLLQIAGQLLDTKIEYVEKEMIVGRFSPMRLLIFLAKMYRPVLRLRLKYNFSACLIEHSIRTLLMRFAGKLHNI